MVKLVGEDARDLHVAALDVSAGDVLHRNVIYALQHINDVMNRNQLCIAPP